MGVKYLGPCFVRCRLKLFCCCLWIASFGTLPSFCWAQSGEKEPSFEIKSFSIQGNTIFPEKEIREVLRDFAGPGKTAADVEKARSALEKLYHEKGYPAVLVNIPEQSVAGGIIRLQVIESKIGNVRVTGNRYTTADKIRRDLPSLAPGRMLHVPDVQRDIGRINRSQDVKVSPVLSPGRELGKTDVEIKVEDRLPLHGSLELNNRGTHDTTALRLNALIGYSNLWQRDHSLSLQYQMSPEDLDEVKAFAFSYILPNPWNADHQLALYGIWSDSETAFGQGFQTFGRGRFFGARYVIPLPPHRLYSHVVTLGLDYKDVDETVGFTTGEGGETKTPVTYLPLSFAYSSSIPDSSGLTRFSAGLNMAFRGLVTDERQFEEKRFKAGGNYIYFTGGIERVQNLPAGMGLFLKVDGQIADQPLISNEQYIAGGMKSVRGYKESEALGDHAVHAVAELSGPDAGALLGLERWIRMIPYLFYDAAWLKIQDPLPDQDERITLQGAGAGIRGNLLKYWEYEMDWAFVLSETDRTPRYSNRVHFLLKFQF